MNGERRLSLAMHAFPRRFRAARGEEVRGVVAERVAAGDTTAYSWRACADVVLSGWRERLRTRPPIGRYLWYRLGGRLPAKWHDWMLDDLDGWYAARCYWLLTIVMTIVMWLGHVLYRWASPTTMLGSTPWALTLSFTLSFFVFSVVKELRWHSNRKHVLTKHGYTAAFGQWGPPGTAPAGPPAAHLVWRVGPTVNAYGIALLVVAPFAACSLFVPSVTLRRVNAGVFEWARDVSQTVLAGGIAAAVAVVLATVGWVMRERLMARLLTTADAVRRPPWPLPVRVEVKQSFWYTTGFPAALAVFGVAASMLPVAPMIVPMVFLAAAGLAPTLIVLGRRAAELEASTGKAVWLRRTLEVSYAAP